MKLFSIRGLLISTCVICAIVAFAACDPEKSKKSQIEQSKLHLEIGTSYFYKGDYISALRELMKSIELDPQNPDTNYLLGTTYYLLQKPIEAETYLLKTIQIQPDYPDAYNNLGSVYMSQGRYGDAIVQFEKCLTYILYQPNFPVVHTNIGIAYMKIGNAAKAEENFKAAIKMDDKFCPAHLNLADLLGKANRSSESVVEYERVLAFCGGTSLSLLANLYIAIELNNLGQKDEACKHLFTVIEQGPNTESAVKAQEYIRLMKCR